MNIFTGLNSLMGGKKCKYTYLTLSCDVFRVGDILDSKGNGFKVISYGRLKIVEKYKITWWRKLFKVLGIKFRKYTYKCIEI